MSMPRLISRLLTLFWAASAPLLAQTPTTVASGTTRAIEGSRAVTGVRIDVQPDGSVWFLIPSADRIAQLQGETLRQWQIRQDRDLGANPVDFEIDGTFVWFIESGESLIDAGKSVFARLDTTNGQLREWIVPGSRPAGFYRAPDGKVWIAQTDRRLQSVDLTTLEVVDYRSGTTIAYSDIVAGPDGALWMTDFGNNRLIRYERGASSETSWVLAAPGVFGRIDPSQIQFDEQGNLWISELTGNQMDRFNPATNELTGYGNFSAPVHFDLFAGRVYVAEAPGGNGRVVVLDPAFAPGSRLTLNPATLSVGASANPARAIVRDRTITPTVTTSRPEAIADAELRVSTPGPGVLRTEFPVRNGFGISAAGGDVWVGSEGRLVRLALQTIGTPSDLTVPIALEFGPSDGARIQTEITMFNRGTAPISGEALYLFSPGSFAPRTTFTVAPGETLLLPDAFRETSSASVLALGPVRIRVTSGAASDLVASVRSALTREEASFGFSLPAISGAETLGAGASRTLFTGNRPTEVSIFGFYSPAGASFTASLVAPNGVVRGTRAFTLAPNIAQEFNPAASAFGVASQPGDVLRVAVASGSLQPYVTVLDLGTIDVALSPPVEVTRDGVMPNVGTLAAGGGGSFVSDLFLANSDTANPANVMVTFTPLSATSPPSSANLTLPPGGSRAIENVLPVLFNVGSGQGALRIVSDAPVAASARIASRREVGDYATFAPALDRGDSIPGGGAALAFGVPQTAARRTHLLLYNSEAAGTATIIGFDAAGTEVGRLPVNIGANQATRVNSVFAQLGAADQRVGRIRVETGAGMRVFALTAEVDAATGDVEIARLRSP